MRTIRGRLLWMLLAGLTVVLTAGGAAVYWVAEHSLVRQLDAGLTARAHTLASLVKLEPEALIFESGDAPAATMKETYFELLTVSGEMLKRSDNLAGSSLPNREPVEHELVFDDVELPGDVDGRAIWLAFRPRVDAEDWEHAGEHPVPELLVVKAAMDRGPVDRALATLLGALIAVGSVVAVTVGVLVAAGVKWGLAPVDRLSRELAGVSGKTISKRFDDAEAPGELAPVYRELNRMLDRVQQTLERERAFADAAAHELRTPLAELHTMAEVAVRWPDAERATASLREILAIGREMERLVESLLLISRADANFMKGDPNGVSVASIVNDCLQRGNGAIHDRKLNLTVDLDDRSTVQAPRQAMEIVVRNLIDNAVRYTPAHGSIVIRDQRTADTPFVLIVENGPVVLNAKDVPRLFEPFWRAESSRSDREHVGLGLTVVYQIARAIGLCVDAELAGDRLQMRISAAAGQK